MNSGALPLRDIHLPEAVSWWPLAPGWWLLAVLLLVAAATVIVMLRRPASVIQLARAELTLQWRNWQNDKNARQLLLGLSQTLRRMAIAAGGREMHASVTGEQWRELLNESMPDAPFDAHPGSLLIDAAYRPSDVTLTDTEAKTLVRLCEHRIRQFAQSNGTAG